MPTSPHDDLLLRHLESAHDPCPLCGYDLFEAPAARCPECAAELRLTVASVQARSGPWLVAVISAALALGFDAVVTLIMLAGTVFAWVRTGVPPRSQLVLAALFGALTGAVIIALVITIRRRRAWMQLTPRAQWALGWAIFVVIGVTHVLFAAFIFALA